MNGYGRQGLLGSRDGPTAVNSDQDSCERPVPPGPSLSLKWILSEGTPGSRIRLKMGVPDRKAPMDIQKSLWRLSYWNLLIEVFHNRLKRLRLWRFVYWEKKVIIILIESNSYRIGG
jgi:hypothetical protein